MAATLFLFRPQTVWWPFLWFLPSPLPVSPSIHWIIVAGGCAHVARLVRRAAGRIGARTSWSTVAALAPMPLPSFLAPSLAPPAGRPGQLLAQAAWFGSSATNQLTCGQPILQLIEFYRARDWRRRRFSLARRPA